MIIVNLALYGPIAKHAGGKYIATLDLELDDTATIQKILEKIKLPSNEKGYLFVNSTLCDMPGLKCIFAGAFKKWRSYRHFFHNPYVALPVPGRNPYVRIP